MVKHREEDHVDRLLHEVKERFPALDLRVEGIVDRVGGIQRRIKRMLDETLEEHGLNAGEWHVLWALFRAPERRWSPGELSSYVELSSAAMTNRLDRLEQAGLVRRVPMQPTAAQFRSSSPRKGRRSTEKLWRHRLRRS